MFRCHGMAQFGLCMVHCCRLVAIVECVARNNFLHHLLSFYFLRRQRSLA